ncbi:tetratricopeptide repeat protein [Vibrio coralliilyticus]|uniref:tetratricopeptide repeat protein n=1 Tax=Vibrio coralliilyticus TaxID=190893 RepID=UPI00148E16E2|nr:tetratricopeptide repeat protein [Vibrio coralliilyticus]NOH53534.1 tetratricopeptide repeat protein [Vibrio coralliilyticus]
MIRNFIIVAFSALILGCQSTTAEQKNEDLKLAETALTSGHADNALNIYKEKLKLSPNDIELLFLTGAACNQSGRFDEALHYLEKGYQLSPSAEFERELGRAHLALGNLSLATESLVKSTRNNEDDDVALNSLGVSYSLQKNYAKARSAFQKALNHKPDSLEYRNNLALAWMLDGNPQQSIRILFPIYQRGESSSKLRLNLALSYAMSGDVEAAKAVAASDLSKAELESNLAYYSLLASSKEKPWL